MSSLKDTCKSASHSDNFFKYPEVGSKDSASSSTVLGTRQVADTAQHLRGSETELKLETEKSKVEGLGSSKKTSDLACVSTSRPWRETGKRRNCDEHREREKRRCLHRDWSIKQGRIISRLDSPAEGSSEERKQRVISLDDEETFPLPASKRRCVVDLTCQDLESVVDLTHSSPGLEFTLFLSDSDDCVDLVSSDDGAANFPQRPPYRDPDLTPELTTSSRFASTPSSGKSAGSASHMSVRKTLFLASSDRSRYSAVTPPLEDDLVTPTLLPGTAIKGLVSTASHDEGRGSCSEDHQAGGVAVPMEVSGDAKQGRPQCAPEVTNKQSRPLPVDRKQTHPLPVATKPPHPLPVVTMQPHPLPLAIKKTHPLPVDSKQPPDSEHPLPSNLWFSQPNWTATPIQEVRTMLGTRGISCAQVYMALPVVKHLVEQHASFHVVILLSVSIVRYCLKKCACSPRHKRTW